MKLFGTTERKITSDKNVENAPQLETPEVALVHCNYFNDQHQDHSRVSYTFAQSNSFVQLLNISLTSHS